MLAWILLPDDPLTDDRAYLVGYLKGVFDEIIVSRVSRTAMAAPPPERRPDLVLNLISARSKSLLEDIEAKARAFGVPFSPLSDPSWRTEDKRTYLADFPDASPSTVVARTLGDVRQAFETFGGDIVVKDPLGDRGRGVERIRTLAELQIAEELMAKTIDNELIVQPFLFGFAAGDKRIVLQRTPDDSFEIIAYIMRKPPAGGWKSNIRAGGSSLRTELTAPERELALALAPRTGLDNVGLDIAEHDGRLYYIEHNQGYGGVIDFDLDRDTCCLSSVAAFLTHLARHGRGV